MREAPARREVPVPRCRAPLVSGRSTRCVSAHAHALPIRVQPPPSLRCSCALLPHVRRTFLLIDRGAV